MGNCQFWPSVFAHATLHTANKALEMETPRDLHLLKMYFVRAGSKETVGTIVRRSFALRRGKLCPP